MCWQSDGKRSGIETSDSLCTILRKHGGYRLHFHSDASVADQIWLVASGESMISGEILSFIPYFHAAHSVFVPSLHIFRIL